MSSSDADTSANHEISYSPSHAPPCAFISHNTLTRYEKHVLSSLYSFMQPPFALPHTAPLFDSVLAARCSIVHQTSYITRVFAPFFNMASTCARQNLREKLERLKVFEGRLSVKLIGIAALSCSIIGDDDPAIYCVIRPPTHNTKAVINNILRCSRPTATRGPAGDCCSLAQ
jgi:hypothetical protein